MGDYYYYYYRSNAWDIPDCFQKDLTNSKLKLFKADSDDNTAHNNTHVSFLSEDNSYMDMNMNMNILYSIEGPYNIYQIEQKINILTKNLYQIMMEIYTCTRNATYDDSTGEYKGGGYSDCGHYITLSSSLPVGRAYWDLNQAYSRLVPLGTSNKTLCQQYHDLKNLVRNFRRILSAKISHSTLPPTPIATQNYNNSLLRDEIEKKLDNIYSNADSRELDSVRMLDSTVYTSVLWTVLATSVIFFMFKKM